MDTIGRKAKDMRKPSTIGFLNSPSPAVTFVTNKGSNNMRFSKIIFIAMAIVPLSVQAKPVPTPASLPADDYGFFFKPYVGADYDYIHANYNDGGDQVANNSMHGGDIHVGARLHKYFGVEASYVATTDAAKNNVLGTGINTKVNVRGATLDALGYLPLADKLEIIGTAGVSRLRGEMELKGAGGHISSSESETKGRVGGGAQYWLTDNLNIRGLVRYQGADFSGSLNNATIASLGFNWQF